MNATFSTFDNEEEALAKIAEAGYHPVTLDFPAESNSDHWHDFDSFVFVLDGEVEITDAETGESVRCGAGTCIAAPGGLLHRENTEGYRALIGFSVDPATLTQPVNKPPPVVQG